MQFYLKRQKVYIQIFAKRSINRYWAIHCSLTIFVQNNSIIEDNFLSKIDINEHHQPPEPSTPTGKKMVSWWHLELIVILCY